jgi:hypothetical protein
MPALIDIRRRIRSVAFSAAEAFLGRRAAIHSLRGVSTTLKPERGRE